MYIHDPIVLDTANPTSPVCPIPTTEPADLSFSGQPLDLEPWPEPVQPHAILDELAATLKRFVVLPAWAPETLALWSFHTYAFRLRDVSTYLGIESPEKRCGKTTLLTILGELVHRPVIAANISPSAFFRVIEELSPTLLIDEADTFLEGNDELRGILNSGYKRQSAYVVRVGPAAPQRSSPSPSSSGDSQRHFPRQPQTRLARFSCWCPKAIAAIGRLPDALADRSIVIRMHRKTVVEVCERFRTLDTTTLRRQCARIVLDHAATIAAAHPEIPPALNDRAADIWEPLLALADLAGKQWPDLARQAAVALTSHAQDTNPIASLLLDIFVVFTTSKSDRLLSRPLVAELNSFANRAWIESRNGKPISESSLAQLLRPYGIQPRTLRVDGLRGKGYFKADFMDVFRRYIPMSEIEALRAEVEADAQSDQEAT